MTYNTVVMNQLAEFKLEFLIVGIVASLLVLIALYIIMKTSQGTKNGLNYKVLKHDTTK